jgi:S-adenosylmethionine:tRNA ribosyltransferase-isomerase
VFALADYDYPLPPERIAQEPARPRDAARLLVVGRDRLDGRRIADLPEVLNPGDLLVVNDTRVIPAQLEGMAGRARIGVTLDQPLPDGTWKAVARNARRLKPGTVIDFGATTAEVIARAGGTVRLRFAGDPTEAASLALPPYIARAHGPTEADADDYQTTFARHPGAVAAPTAGLHLTPRLIEALAARGIRFAAVTLHVGAGTFLPIRVDDVRAHRLHAERATLPAETAEAIAAARHAGGRIVAVGTTSLRTLETAARATGTVQPFAGETDLYITPGFDFRAADLLLTNFHLPRTSLMVLVSAFAGRDRIMGAYAHALASGYRFGSYGDATLLERA